MRCSCATDHEEVRAANTGSRLIRIAVWVGEVYLLRPGLRGKAEGCGTEAVIATAEQSVPLQTQRGCSIPVAESRGKADAIVAGAAVVATWITASAPTE